jgi:integrase/recombinase XerD
VHFGDRGLLLGVRDHDDGKVRNYRLHGLRKAALIELAYKGATGLELLAISGHKNLSEVQPYIEAAEQKRLAAAAHAKRLAGTKR